MGAFTDFLEGKLIDELFRGIDMAPPATLYVGLFTAMPTDVGTDGTEVSGGGYARVAVPADIANWGAPTAGDGTTSNLNDIVFPAPTANWGQVVGWGIWDAAANGNLLFYGSLTTPKTINNGDPAPKFTAGSLQVTLD